MTETECGSTTRPKEKGDAMTGFRDVVVERIDRDQIEIRWKSDGQPGLVSIYEGSTPDEIDTDRPGAQPSGDSVVLLRPSQLGRRYYRVVAEDGHGRVAAERLLPFEGMDNFRDLGGYETADGQTVKWGWVYRSGELNAASKADLAYLSRLDIEVILDLRPPEDMIEAPDPVPRSDTRMVRLGMFKEELLQLWQAFLDASSKEAADAISRRLYSQWYRVLIRDFTDEFAVIFEMLADPSNLPAVIHCSGGQDRTGMVAAVLLMLLGVPHDTVVADYLLTPQTGGPADEWIAQHPHPAAVESFWDAREEYLEAGIDEINRRYGSLEKYASDGLGLTSSMVDQLRKILLCP